MSGCFSQALGRFRRDENGAIAMLFGLTLTIVLMVTGLAIDVGRAVHAASKIASALDAASLAGAKGLRLQNLTDPEVTALSQKLFDENYLRGGSYAAISSFVVDIDRANSKVGIDVQADVPTVFAQLFGVDTLPIPRSSVAIFEARDIEVGLQLDVTGSMGGQKIADLKVATKDLVDILIPNTPTGQTVRVGLAPFAAGVNAGSYASAVNGGVAAPNACVYERQQPGYQDSDAFPAGLAALKTRLDLSSSANNCPSARILPMTDDKALLKSTVDGYAASGFTAGHLGTAWAWYLISPEWAPIWPSASEPAPYDDGETIKVAVLMTDGDYNTVGGRNGFSTQSGNFAKDTCSEMKAKGVVVYTVGFRLPAAGNARDVMNDCASGTEKAFLAEDGDQLRAAFRSVAEDISTLRISN